MVPFDQKPESNLRTIGPVAPALRSRATSSSTNRLVPRWVLADPLRIRACTISPVSALLAGSGWYGRTRHDNCSGSYGFTM